MFASNTTRFCSGRLPFTIGKAVTDYAAQVIYSGSGIVSIPYNEGLFIDYRHFDQVRYNSWDAGQVVLTVHFIG